MDLLPVPGEDVVFSVDFGGDEKFVREPEGQSDPAAGEFLGETLDFLYEEFAGPGPAIRKLLGKTQDFGTKASRLRTREGTVPEGGDRGQGKGSREESSEDSHARRVSRMATI